MKSSMFFSLFSLTITIKQSNYSGSLKIILYLIKGDLTLTLLSFGRHVYVTANVASPYPNYIVYQLTKPLAI